MWNKEKLSNKEVGVCLFVNCKMRVSEWLLLDRGKAVSYGRYLSYFNIDEKRVNKRGLNG